MDNFCMRENQQVGPLSGPVSTGFASSRKSPTGVLETAFGRHSGGLGLLSGLDVPGGLGWLAAPGGLGSIGPEAA